MEIFGILVYKNSMNIGDEIQSVAAAEILRSIGIKIEALIDRDTGSIVYDENLLKLINNPLIDSSSSSSLSNHIVSKSLYERKITTSHCNVIYNGWFDGNYCLWPPPTYVNPFLISLHVNEVSKDDSYKWLDKYKRSFMSLADPSLSVFYLNKSVGCRDPHTYKLMKDVAESYISGCLTTTLCCAQLTTSSRSGIYLVDVPASKLKLVPKNILDASMELTHVYEGNSDDHIGKFERAYELLNLYARARLVITSRLHCALPCVAYGTTVVFCHDTTDVRIVGLADSLPQLSENLDWSSLHSDNYSEHYAESALLMRKKVIMWALNNRC